MTSLKRWFLCLLCLPFLGLAQSVETDFELLEGAERAEAIKIYVHQNQNDTSSRLLALAQEGLALAHSENLPAYEVAFMRLTGSVLMARNQVDSAFIWLDRALLKAQKLKLDDEIGETKGVIGSAYYRKYHLESAVEYWIPTLDYLEQTNKVYSLGVRLTQIGNAYLMLGETKTGVLYNKKALDIDTIKTMDFMLGRIYNSLGYGYDELKDYDSAVYFYEKAFEIGKASNDVERMGLAKINICAAYESQAKNADALVCLKETIAFLKENGLHDYLVHVYTTQVNLQLNTGQAQNAFETLDSIKHYLKLYPEEEIRLQLPEMESKAFEATGEYQAALNRYKKHMRMHDSVLTASRLAEIEELRLAYETEKLDEQIKAAKREAQLKDERNQRTQNLWIASTVAILLFMGFILLAVNRRSLKRKKELAEHRVHHQLEVLKATIDGQEQERKRIARELHDGIGQQFTAIKMAYESLAEKVDAKAEKMSDLIEHAARDVRTLSHQMMPRVLQEVGVEAAIRDLVEGLQSSSGPTLSYTSRNMEERLTEQQEINIYRICQELLNNAIKHGDAKEINVMFYKADGRILLVVDDNGRGASKEEMQGHGFMNINSRVDAIGAEYSIETASGQGFTFSLRLPV